MIILLLACMATNFDYELGYEHGCNQGITDAVNCAAEDDGYLDASGSSYARGLSDGYADCYESWEEC